MTEVQVCVLGRPRIEVAGHTVALGERQVLLAVRLALGRRLPLSTSRLLEDVWPAGRGTPGALRVALTRLRTALGADAVERSGAGYTLGPGCVLDADRFEALVRDARDRSRARAERIEMLDRALALWDGPPFEEIEAFPWLAEEIVRLTELRESAVDLRFELAMVDGDASALVPQLRVALAQEPTRERRAEMLALALYRTGRQTEALEVVAQVRDRLREALGLSISPSLADLELRMLRHDSDLMPAVRARPWTGGQPAASRLKAAHALMRSGVYEEALAIVDDVEADARARGDARTTVQALLARATTLTHAGLGDPDPAIDEAQQLAREQGAGDLLARAALVRAGAGVPADKLAALVELAEPLELLEPAAPERVDLLCAAAIIVAFIDASPAVERLVAEADAVHAAVGSPRSEAMLLASRSILAAVRRADPATVLDCAKRSYDAARRSGDPQVVAVAIQALLRGHYARGDIDAVDALLPELQRASDQALLGFGAVRVALARTTNAIVRGDLAGAEASLAALAADGRRHRSFSAVQALGLQHMLLLYERDELDALAALVRPRAAAHGPSAWYAVLALCEPPHEELSLVELAPQVPVDDSYPPWLAFAAEVAARRGDRDLGRWCAPRLDELGAGTIMIGFGTVVMGFAAHFAGLAHLAAGDVESACRRLERSIELCSANGATLWLRHSEVELARALLAIADDASVARATQLLACVTDSPLVAVSQRLARRVREVIGAPRG